MIHFVEYNSETTTLRVRFDGGEVYDYYLVPPDAGRAAEVALSGGDHGYFKTSIKGIYPFTRVR
jgi:hypothetical protein